MLNSDWENLWNEQLFVDKSYIQHKILDLNYRTCQLPLRGYRGNDSLPRPHLVEDNLIGFFFLEHVKTCIIEVNIKT